MFTRPMGVSPQLYTVYISPYWIAYAGDLPYAFLRFSSHLYPPAEASVIRVDVYITEWSLYMAKAIQDFGVNFVELRIPDHMKDESRKWVETTDFTPAEYIAHLIYQNYKVSISHDAANDCVICAVTGKESAKKNDGLCLVTRGPDVDTAILLTAYKIEVLCDNGVWGDGKPRKNNWG